MMGGGMTFAVRVQNLEKRLDDYQSRLEQEEKRRNFLEDWIRLNFDFDIQYEFEKKMRKTPQYNRSKTNSTSTTLTSSTPAKKLKPISGELPAPPKKPKSDLKPQQLELDQEEIPHSFPITTSSLEVNLMNPADFCEVNDNDNSCPSSELSNNEYSQPQRQRPGGRQKDTIWKYFKQVPIPGCTSKITVRLYCKKCGQHVSVKASRMRFHVDQCLNNPNYTPKPRKIRAKVNEKMKGSDDEDDNDNADSEEEIESNDDQDNSQSSTQPLDDTNEDSLGVSISNVMTIPVHQQQQFGHNFNRQPPENSEATLPLL